MPTRISCVLEMSLEQAGRKPGFIPCQVKRGDTFPLGKQGFQFLFCYFLTIRAAENTYQVYFHTIFLFPLSDAIHHGFHNFLRVQVVGFSHEPGAEAQFDIIQSFQPGVLHVFTGNPLAGGGIDQDSHGPMEFFNESHHPWLGIGYLDVRTQTFQVPGGKGNIMFPTQVKNCLEAEIAIQMAVQFHEGNGGIDQMLKEFLYVGEVITLAVLGHNAVDDVGI